eukprot:scaffold11773_cov66-Phaeocystis_antarctica.AAC.2
MSHLAELVDDGLSSLALGSIFRERKRETRMYLTQRLWLHVSSLQPYSSCRLLAPEADAQFAELLESSRCAVSSSKSVRAKRHPRGLERPKSRDLAAYQRL